MHRLKGSLAWRLTVWFLLLSLLPIGAMALFVRHTVADSFLDLAARETQDKARLLAAQIAPSGDKAAVRAILTAATDEHHSAFILDRAGGYLARPEPAMDDSPLLADLLPATVERLRSGGEGSIFEEETGRLIGYYTPPAGGAIAVTVTDASLVSASISRMETTSFGQLATSLALISIIGGLAIWIVIGPIQQLTRAAKEVGTGNLNVAIDPSQMEGELEVLATAFNQMTKQLRESYDDLERRVADRTRELAVLNAISTVVSRSLDLQEVLQAALDKTMEVVDVEAGAAYRLDVRSQMLMLTARRGLSEDFARRIARLSTKDSFSWQVACAGQPMVVQVNDYPAGALRALFEREGFRSIVSVPLLAKGHMVGAIKMATHTRRTLGPEDVALLAAIGHQVGVAVENARLYESAEESATVAERNRLARDLHDAVTQTLFSASLIAEVLPRLWQRNPAEGERRLAELRQLTRGALAEMRTLLLEMRPVALLEAPLGSLLRQLTEATIGRARLPVSLSVDGEQPLPPDVQVAFYRIAQEALNNVVKHSDAREAAVALRLSDRLVEMAVSDNGRGFDPAATSPDHLGMGIIRERAQAVGAVVAIESQLGQGTAVKVSWTNPKTSPNC